MKDTALPTRRVKPKADPTVLLVESAADLLESTRAALEQSIKCRLLVAQTAAQARRIIATQAIDLMVSNVALGDGRGVALIQTLHQYHPTASAMVLSSEPCVDDAVNSLRCGAVDFVSMPAEMAELVNRVGQALARQLQVIRDERRIDRLRGAVKKLNDSRRMVNKKVDLLCNDLVTAYAELARQLEEVRTTESFRAGITQSKNLEQLLRHTLDWLLRQMGYANAAIWLASDEGPQQNAYMKCTIACTPQLVEAMRTGIIPRIMHDELIHADNQQLRKRLSPAELPLLGGQTLLGVHCKYLGKSLATVVLFRDAAKVFSAEHATTLRAIAPIFATALVGMIHNGEPQDCPEPNPSKDPVSGKIEKDDEADWWKRGESAPF